MASINLEKLAFEVDKIYIKSISVVKGSKYPHKQHIKNRPKSEMVYPGIFDLIDKKYKFNNFLNNFLKTQKGWNNQLCIFSKIFGPKDEDSVVISMVCGQISFQLSD